MKKIFFKKTVSIILSLCMIFSMMMTSAFAFTASSPESDFIIYDGVLRKYIGTSAKAVIPDGVTSIEYSAFADCDHLTNVVIPDSVVSINSHAFESCSNLTEVTIPDSVTSIAGYVFYNCSNLTKVTIPDSVTSLGHGAFHSCTSLKSITIPARVTEINEGMFYGCTSLTEITIPDIVTSIGNASFSFCTNLKSIIIPESVVSMGDFVFRECESLTEVTIPKSVASIGTSAFLSCENLTKIIVDEENPAYSSAGGVLFDKAKTSLICYPTKKEDSSYIIPESVTSIEELAFGGCDYLTEVIIPKSVDFIHLSPFENCGKLTKIIVDEENPAYSSADGVLFDKAKTELINYPAGKTDVSYIIPGSVASIGYYAFYNCSNLTEVTIPESVTSFGYAVFAGCDNLTINGYADSYTHKYADANNIPIVFIKKRPIDNMKDIQSNHWAYAAIAKCMDEGILHGKGGNEFDPDRNMTRAEFCQMIYNYYKNTEVMQGSTDKSFTDVPEDEWYAQAVLACARSGIVNGVDENHFEPDSQIKREDVCVIMMRILMGSDKVSEIDADAKIAELKEKGNKLADIESTSNYALKYVLCAVGVIINGDKDEGTIRPLDNISRAECAQIMYNYLFKQDV